MSSSRITLSLQIAGSLIIVFGLGLFSLLVVGHNAIQIADNNAQTRQTRFAARSLAATLEAIPEQQRSATIWDDAIRNTAVPDATWLDDNLGTWMQEYFGHNENYVLDQADQLVFAATQGERQPPEVYASRAAQIAPLVADLRRTVAEVSAGLDNPNEALATVGVVRPVRFDDLLALVSVVPIISDSGEIVQETGTEAVHVAIRYVDAALAQAIGAPIELDNIAIDTAAPTGAKAGIPLAAPSGEVFAWLVWTPERPGMALFLNMLPVLLAVALAGVALLLWIVRRLLGISRQLQKSEAQAQLDLAALNQAYEAAEVAAQAKMNFMSVVSHELRTPLTVILGYARLGKNLANMPCATGLQDQLHQHPVNLTEVKSSVDGLLRNATTGMEKIERSGEHLLFLVNQLLDYAKMETGRLEIDPEICDVRAVVEPVVDQMRVLTQQKGLTLDARLSSCLMLADVTRTRQILINLMGNAIKFTDAGTISVEVTDSEDWVHIGVRDTGTGIEAHELEKIFEAFHQADLSSSRSAAGTGLGLAVAQELARLEGGTIEVQSVVGRGSTFTLSLPKDRSAALENAA